MGIHGPVTEAQRDTLARIDRSQRHLLRLINHVLNLSRIEAGRVEYQMEDVPAAEIAAAARLRMGVRKGGHQDRAADSGSPEPEVYRRRIFRASRGSRAVCSGTWVPRSPGSTAT